MRTKITRYGIEINTIESEELYNWLRGNMSPLCINENEEESYKLFNNFGRINSTIDEPTLLRAAINHGYIFKDEK